MSTARTDCYGMRLGDWMVERMGHDASPVELFGIFRLGLVDYTTHALGNRKQWVFVDYTLTQEQAFNKVSQLATDNAVIWRV